MKGTERIFWGLLLIGAAVFLVLNQMGLISAKLSVGMIAMGVICIAIFVSSVVRGSFGGVFTALGLAWLTFDKLLGIPQVSWQLVLLVVVLLTVGFHFLFPSKARSKMGGKKNWDDYEDVNKVGEKQKVEFSEESNFVMAANALGATAKYINSKDLQGAKLHNKFGEMKIYFDGAMIVTSPVTVTVSNNFGQMQLFIPKEWTVNQNVSVFAGEFRENNQPASAEGPVLNIEGTVNFGEVTVTYV